MIFRVACFAFWEIETAIRHQQDPIRNVAVEARVFADFPHMGWKVIKSIC